MLLSTPALRPGVRAPIVRPPPITQTIACRTLFMPLEALRLPLALADH